jgi:hypothetical protein
MTSVVGVLRTRAWSVGIVALVVLLCLTLLAIMGHGGSSGAIVPDREAPPTDSHARLAAFGDPLRDAFKAMPQQALAQNATINCTLETTSTTTADALWNNNDFNTTIQIANYTGLSLVPSTGTPGQSVPTTPDFYRLDNAVSGALYTIQAKPDRTINYNLGIRVYDLDRQVILQDVDTSSYSASVSWVPTGPGPFFIEIFPVSAQCTGSTYSIIYSFAPPTPTPTRTPTAVPDTTVTPSPDATWMSGFDQYEPNFSFELATTIAPGISYRMNFVPWGGADYDNDFLKVRVKPGLQLTCETSDLDPGVDPRMAFYNGPGEQHFLMANDDIALGDFNSRLSYYATYEGWLYILVGQGTRMARRDTVDSSYTVTCQLTAPGQPTQVPGQPPPVDKAPVPPAVPAATATPTTPISPVATPTPDAGAGDVTLTFRLITRPEPPTPTPEPEGFRTFRVLVYFDADLDGQMGAGEGVVGFFVLVLSADGRRELAQGYTDEQGQLSFTVPTVSTVRVLVPLLGYDRLIEASRPEVRVRIVPPTLPEVIP